MEFVRDTVLVVLVALIISMLWRTLVLAFLRACGIAVVLGFNKSERRSNGRALRSLGKWKYVFIVGFVNSTCPIFAAVTVDEYFMGRHHPATLGILVFSFIIWSVAGIWLGLWTWNNPPASESASHTAS